MQAPVKQATLMSQKNNWRLPPAICCPHSLSIRVASIVSASIRAWRPVQNTLLSTSNISLPASLSQVHRVPWTRPIADLFPRGRRYRENSESRREKKLNGEDVLFFAVGSVISESHVSEEAWLIPLMLSYCVHGWWRDAERDRGEDVTEELSEDRSLWSDRSVGPREIHSQLRTHYMAIIPLGTAGSLTYWHRISLTNTPDTVYNAQCTVSSDTWGTAHVTTSRGSALHSKHVILFGQG